MDTDMQIDKALTIVETLTGHTERLIERVKDLEIKVAILEPLRAF